MKSNSATIAMFGLPRSGCSKHGPKHEKIMTTSHVPTPERQYGVALPVALIMTLLIALLGMTMLRGGIISELVASNQQQNSYQPRPLSPASNPSGNTATLRMRSLEVRVLHLTTRLLFPSPQPLLDLSMNTISLPIRVLSMLTV